MRSILHIDVNSAYLSWTAVELLKAGGAQDIRRIPSAIAGDPRARHGIILAKSEPAKQYGIKTAMTLAEARRRCPGLALYPPDHALYRAYSDRMYALLSEYTDVIERFSIDECWLDYTGSEKIFGAPLEAAEKIASRMRGELGFTVNIGVSVNKLLAKMASEMEKPDRIHTLFPEEIPEKMWPLSADGLFGVGRSTKDALARVGLHTIGDVAHADAGMLRQLLKPVMGQLVHDHANGVDDTPVIREEARAEKSIGHSTTTPRDVRTEEEAMRYLLSLSERCGLRLREAGLEAGVVSVELKNTSFYTYRHQKKQAAPVETTTEIYEQACEIFREMWRGDDLRLIGVSLSYLTSAGTAAQQLSLFDDPSASERGKALEEMQDEIRKKYGKDAIKRGTLL
ncbi:MAG: DNA polymerase IV [Clostridiales Family XIII bacterium]|jgi:DNA polymerase-4|nr:DNA polymerase IV [Clostridiales Family XIII bacterium]